MESSSLRADIRDIRVGDEVFDDSGVNGWGTVTGIAENKIEADWHPRTLQGMAERRWVSRQGIRRIYSRSATS